MTFASTITAGDKHKEKKKKSRKAMSGVISVEETEGGADYFLTVHPMAKESKTYDIEFSDKVGEKRPDDGQHVTVRGKFMEDEFVVKSLVLVEKKSMDGNM